MTRCRSAVCPWPENGNLPLLLNTSYSPLGRTYGLRLYVPVIASRDGSFLDADFRTGIASEWPVLAQSLARDASFKNLDLGVKRRCYLRRRNPFALEVRVEKAAQAVRGHGKLAAPVDANNSQQAERSQHDMAFQQGPVVAKEEMVCAPDLDAQPSIGGQPIINRLDVSPNLAALGVGLTAVAAQ